MKKRFLPAAAVLLAVSGMMAGAETPPPYPEFTFKRVSPPKPGAAKRITVQIAPKPVTVPPPPAATARNEAEGATIGAYAWYWDAISPKMTDSGPGRLAPAVVALSKGPGGAQVAAPRLQSLQNIAEAHGLEILKATVGTQVSPALVLAVIGVESSGRAAAVSPKGASGLMQLMPATAERFGIGDAADPVQNIKGGVAYLDWLMTEFDRDPLMVLAGYNAGENAVKSNNGVPPFAETRDYVPKVLAAWSVARGLCVTPPELVTDGCVFRLGRSG